MHGIGFIMLEDGAWHGVNVLIDHLYRSLIYIYNTSLNIQTVYICSLCSPSSWNPQLMGRLLNNVMLRLLRGE
jgi:hypothetical protein